MIGILYVKEYRPGRYFYGEPEYMSACRWVELDYEISVIAESQKERSDKCPKFIGCTLPN
jgi:hypothetical protein